MALNILYVEDQAVFAEQMARMFLGAHRVTIVPSLAEARRAIAESTFDVALVDYDLEDGKGDAFVRILRAKHPRIPIIAASSHEAGNAALKAAGASAICSKMEFDTIGTVLQRLGIDR